MKDTRVCIPVHHGVDLVLPEPAAAAARRSSRLSVTAAAFTAGCVVSFLYCAPTLYFMDRPSDTAFVYVLVSTTFLAARSLP